MQDDVCTQKAYHEFIHSCRCYILLGVFARLSVCFVTKSCMCNKVPCTTPLQDANHNPAGSMAHDVCASDFVNHNGPNL